MNSEMRSVAIEALSASAAADWSTFFKLIHPRDCASLREFELAQIRLSLLVSQGDNLDPDVERLRIVELPGEPSFGSCRQMNAGAFLASWFTATHRQSLFAGHSLPAITLVKAEGDAMFHVLYRSVGQYGPVPRDWEVFGIEEDQGRWYVRPNAEMLGLRLGFITDTSRAR